MHCAIKSTLRQNVVDVICIIVRNVLTRTPVGRRLGRTVLLVQRERTNLVEQSCEGDSDMLLLFNVVHGWFVASFGRQEAAIGLLGGSIR